MKLLYLVPILTYRGSEQVLSHLIEYLHTHGHSLTIITPYMDDTITIPFATIVHPPKNIMRLCKNPILYQFIAPFVFLRYGITNTKKADLIITDNFPCLQIATLLSLLFKKKCMLSIHGLEIETSPSQSTIEKIHHYIVLWLNKLTNQFVKKIIVNSPKVRRNAQKIWTQSEIKVIVPPVVLTITPTSNIRLKYRTADNPILLSVGVLHPLKNQTLLIQAVALVKQKYPNITLILVGDGNRTPLVSLARKLGVENNIVFSGFVPHKYIYEYYQAANLFLQPAFYPEGLSLTVFEAMLANKLTICATGAGAADIIKDENIGVVIEPTPDNFANEVLNYLDKPLKYDAIISRGYNYVKKNLTTTNYGKSFELEILTTISGTQQ